ncbi:MAG: FAD-dependent oxidoreductase [Cyanobacteria bacterium]|nr:FAD-dependent oxidoreductase [Cyanobacteriota bacterium]
MPPEPMMPDVLVLGEEIESVLAAVSAARMGVKTVLLVSDEGRLGGLSTQGGLSYMDITLGCLPPLFSEFLDRAGVKRVGLEPARAEETLRQMLADAGVRVDTQSHLGEYPAQIFIDATPDASLVSALELPCIEGLGGLLKGRQSGSENPPEFIGVSPVFRIHHLPISHLQKAEAEIRALEGWSDILEAALPFHDPSLWQEYVTRPTFQSDNPAEQDYLDILNPSIGIAFHIWKQQKTIQEGAPRQNIASLSTETRLAGARTYAEAPIWIDGGNVACLPEGVLSFNGMVMRVDALPPAPGQVPEATILNRLLAYSQSGGVPAVLIQEMQLFEAFLRQHAGDSEIAIEAPKALYIRQTRTMLTQKNMTARQMLAGGVPEEDAIGVFSYWLDFRGVQLSRYFPGLYHLPKPVFRVGLGCALLAQAGLESWAVVGRSAGYSPVAQGAGRIIQHNAQVGEAVGIAAALAIKHGCPMREIPARSILEVLEARNPKVMQQQWELLKSEQQKGAGTQSTEMPAGLSELLDADDAVMKREY